MKDGVRGFYRGTVPAIILTMPESAFRFGLYEVLNYHWTKVFESVSNLVPIVNLVGSEIGLMQSLINGSISGVAAKAIVYPFDLAKKRLQIQGFDEARKSFGKVMLDSYFKRCIV